MTLHTKLTLNGLIGAALLVAVIILMAVGMVQLLVVGRDDWTARKDAVVKACNDLGYTHMIMDEQRISCTRE